MTASPEPEAKEGTAPRWQVREAVPADYDQICAINWDILRETEGQKTAGFSRTMWEWQYLGPEEKSLITVADDHGTIAGYIHGLRFPFRFRRTRIVSSMTQDAATVPAYRRQGLLRAVHAFAREEFARTGAPFSVGFPNHRSFPDYVRTKYTVVAKVPVYVCPLDFGRLLAPRLGAAGRLLGAVADPVYRTLLSRRPALLAGEEVARIERFGPDIEPISRDFADMVTVAIDRTPRYLNWRFIEKPTREYTAWMLRRGGQPVAYVVTKDGNLYGNPGLILMDFGCRAGEEDALLRLIAARLPAAHTAGAAGAVSMGLHPFFARLGRLGFRRVPERVNPRPFHFVAKALRQECDPAIFDPRSWFVTLADWDVL